VARAYTAGNFLKGRCYCGENHLGARLGNADAATGKPTLGDKRILVEQGTFDIKRITSGRYHKASGILIPRSPKIRLTK